jgi:hypothetical protein
MAAKDPSPTPTSRNPRAASYEATRQDMGSVPEKANTTPATPLQSLKWAGVALLVIAVLLAVYLGAGLLGELAAGAAYP